MKRIFMFLVMGAMSSLFAANVQWDCFATGDEEYWGVIGRDGLMVHYRSDLIQPSFFVTSSRVGGNVTLTGEDVSTLAFVGFWAEMSAGDVIDCSAMIAMKDYFTASGEYDNVVNPYQPETDRRLDMNPKTIETTTRSSIYLAAIVDVTDVEQYGKYYYGWVELKVDARGDVSLGRSAFALDGSAMIVGGGAAGGAIPEPSGAVLVLVGVGLLGLRRGIKP